MFLILDVLAMRKLVRDPAVLNPKGRPRTARITGLLEGPPRGGGPTISHYSLRNAPKRSRKQAEIDYTEDLEDPERPVKRPRISKCSLCRQQGHNRMKCPLYHVIS